MNDPWFTAAKKVRSEKEEQKATSNAAKPRHDSAARSELDLAIDEGEQHLIRFLATRGEAAKELLKAHGMHTFITFGEDRDGSYYDTIFFHYAGIGREYGNGGVHVAYDFEKRRAPNIYAATPRQAVIAFALFGEGKNDPAKVRGIVTWLAQQVDAYSR